MIRHMIVPAFVSATLITAGCMSTSTQKKKLAAPAPAKAESRESILPELAGYLNNHQAVYEISVDESGHGSGIAISDRHILTAAHVVTDAKTIAVMIRIDDKVTEVQWPEKVFARPRSDLAVIEVRGPLRHHVALGDLVTLFPGDSVYAEGYPLEFGPMVARGHVMRRDASVSVSEKQDPKDASSEALKTEVEDAIIADLTVAPGSSGSGLFACRDGRLIGLLVMAMPIQHELLGTVMMMNVFVSVRQVKRFLEDHGIPYTTDLSEAPVVHMADKPTEAAAAGGD